MKQLLLASNNKFKLKEFKEIFKPYEIEILSPKDLDIVFDANETGKTYYQNALIKAKELRKYSNLDIISDDSGIEIEALGKNFPGINSHRYMLSMGGQEKTNMFLAKNYFGTKAKFVCTIVLLKDNKVFKFKGQISGIINDKVKEDPFGYDPIFKIKKYNKTFAELDSKTKNTISHRYRASIKLINFLKNN